MRKRAAQAQATRERIAHATLVCHGRKGVAATSWEDIAAEAGVAIGTVYRHFPSYDELLPACGALFFAGLDLDGLVANARAARDAPDPCTALVDVLFAYWERHADEVDGVRRERGTHPILEDSHHKIEARLDDAVSAALGDQADELDIATVRALTGTGAWRTLMERALPRRDAVSRVARAVHAALGTQEPTARRSECTRAAR
jgi:AcrR family transcriptional regulator